MAESIILTLFGESTRMRILDYLLEFPTSEFTPSELVEAIGMSRTTVFKELGELHNDSMIKQTGKIGKSPMFKINLKNLLVRMLQQSIHYKSDKIAERQLATRNISKLIRANLKTAEELKNRKKLLEQELEFTKEKLKAISAR